MSKSLLALMVFCFALMVLPALALEEPTVTSPREGAALGPNYDVIGSMPYRAFLVVLTDVIRCDTNECVRTIPGIRHWTNDDGSFHFRVASPRVAIGEQELPLAYRVRVFEATAHEAGPEAMVIASCISPGPALTGAQVEVSMQQSEPGAPMVSSPREASALGPSYDIVGRMPQRAFLVVMTDVIDCETGELIRTVPGTRQWTNDDGSFRFRAASPRIMIGERDRPVSYRVRVCETSASGDGPETVINASMAE